MAPTSAFGRERMQASAVIGRPTAPERVLERPWRMAYVAVAARAEETASEAMMVLN